MDNDEQVIGSSDLAITVEMGDDFAPGSRTAAALRELVQALNDEHGDDVGGFEMDQAAVRSFSFVTAAMPGRESFFEAWPCKFKMVSMDPKSHTQG